MVVALNEALLAPLFAQADELRSQIDAVDAKLGVEGSTKAKFLENLADGVAGNHTELSSAIEDTINSLHGDDRVAVVALLRRVLRQYDPEVKASVEKNVPESEQPKVDPEVVKQLREERKNLVTAYSSCRSLISMSAPESLTNYPEIQNLRGAVGGTGKRGKRLARKYTWTVDGKEVNGNNFSHVGVAAGGVNATDVRLALNQAIPASAEDAWFENPPETFSFELNGKSVVATQVASTNGHAVDEADDEDDVFDVEDIEENEDSLDL